MQAVLKIDIQDMAVQMFIVFAGTEWAKNIKVKRQQSLEDWVRQTTDTFVQQPKYSNISLR